MKRILVAVDRTPESRLVLEAAGHPEGRARERHGMLRIVAAVDSSDTADAVVARANALAFPPGALTRLLRVEPYLDQIRRQVRAQPRWERRESGASRSGGAARAPRRRRDRARRAYRDDLCVRDRVRCRCRGDGSARVRLGPSAFSGPLRRGSSTTLTGRCSSFATRARSALRWSFGRSTPGSTGSACRSSTPFARTNGSSCSPRGPCSSPRYALTWSARSGAFSPGSATCTRARPHRSKASTSSCEHGSIRLRSPSSSTRWCYAMARRRVGKTSTIWFRPRLRRCGEPWRKPAG